MPETSETYRSRTLESLPIAADPAERQRKAAEERCQAVRRWIDDDDEPACRGID